jgi:transposase InsO family protein
MSLLAIAIAALLILIAAFLHNKEPRVFRKQKAHQCHRRRLPKPPWVKREIIRIKAHMQDAGCRQVADIFNRRFAAEKGMTVGKTYVHKILCEYMAEVLRLRKQWKHRIPRYMSVNAVWGMDMTGVADARHNVRTLLGIVDHGTRKCLSLQTLSDKTAIALLRKLLDAIEVYGKPKAIHTDNESMFVSRLFRFALWLLGIRHRRSMLHCPWQNGRIERFFGTFKAYADRVVFNAKRLQAALDEFAFWYNSVRPHRHLGGRTPEEAWNNIEPYEQAPKICRKFSAWHGMLRGYRIGYG